MTTLAQKHLLSLFDDIESKRQQTGYYKQQTIPTTQPITAKEKGVTKPNFKVGDLIKGKSFAPAGIVTKIVHTGQGWYEISFLVTHKISGTKVTKVPKAKQSEMFLRHDEVESWDA